tara:strand:- start:655 stop:1410 length:756 start_codon:yes stop_codon:yes gene_type:complete
MICRFILILLVSINNLFGFNASDSVFEHSNQLYSSNLFEEALNGYMSILDTEASQVLYYNIGNCYYKLDMLGYARLYYEKAKLYNPTDKDVVHNIKIIQNRLVDDVQPVPDFFLVKIIKAINSIFNSSQWGYVLICVFYLNIFLFIIFLFSVSVEVKVNSLRAFVFSVPLFLIVVFFVFYSNSEQQYQNAILLDTNSYVKTAPSLSSADYFIIHEGVKFQLIDELDGWSRILLPDGKDGWVQNSSFQKIEI